ncbi:LysM peptidoglycan-binding domain-containing protein [Lysobacter enzymogenes]|uniref:LysM peptidoglycan-binding domain-containing protein n=1 Tax=Lysobacter enzymogenes TaxID=69 RepID=UPI00384F95DD
MVAIVTGNGLGLQASSALGLGGRGQVGSAGFGKAGEQAFVNAATGNLILRDRDQWLMGRGVDAELYRAYNSQAQLVGETWRAGVSKQVGGLTGTVNTAGSAVYRTDWDGSRIAYAWDAARSLYVASEGAGTRDTLAWDGGNQRWTWTQGGSQLIERYDAANNGRLIESVDRDGNAVSYVYNGAGALREVRTANGEITYLDYSGNGRLSQLRTVTQTANGTQTSTAVRYGYDSAGRLSTVTLDLSPDDNSVVDGKVFTTTYGYDGSSGRIASITQSDGAKVAFGYQLIDGQYRVVSIAQTSDAGVLRTTTLSYDTANRRTTVVDPLGQDTILSYDAQGRLLQTSSPMVNGARQTQTFTYDAAGQVATIRDGLGNEVKYTYDAAGNLIKQEDAVGTVVERTFGSDNQLLSETVSGPNTATATTRYVYDAEQHLRFKVSAEGRVTQWRYNAEGQAIALQEYADARYAGTGFSEASLAAWAGAQTIGEQTDYGYDFRGNLVHETRYQNRLQNGNGINDPGMVSVRYVYDAQGRLLQRYQGQGATTDVEQFTYDGLGRMLTATAFDDSVTVTQYDDAQRRTIVSFANGLVRTSSYNRAGELIAVSESGSGGTVLSQVSYRYDSNGRLRATEDALGARTHVLYDEAGRRVAEIDAAGTLTEFVYDANNQILRTTRYAAAANAAALAGLIGANGELKQTVVIEGQTRALTLANSGLRPAADAAKDRSEWRFYDAAGRLSKTVGADGALVQYAYDAASRLVSTLATYKRVDMATFLADPSAANAVSLGSDFDKSMDRPTRYFYDADGLLRGRVDADFNLVETVYDAMGRKVREIAYARPAELAAGTTIDQIRPSRDGADRIRDYLYDQRGLLTAEIDGEGYVTRYWYDSAGNVSQRIRGSKVSQVAYPLTTPVRFGGSLKARATAGADGVWPKLEVWVDGAKVQTVTLNSTINTYNFFADAAVSGNHQVALVVVGADSDHQVWIEQASYAGVAFDAGGAIWDAGGDGANAGTPSVRPAGTQQIAAAGALRWAVRPEQVLNLVAPAAGVMEITDYQYDLDGRLLKQTEYSSSGNTVSQFRYDSQGRVVEQSRADRKALTRYDALGRVVAELSGEGAKALEALGSGATAAQIDAVWRDRALRYAYDAGGRLASVTDALDRVTLYYYDAMGRATHVVNPAGEVVEQRYNAFGDVVETVTYAKRLTSASLGQMRGGALSDDVRQAFALLDDAQASRVSLSYAITGLLNRRIDALGGYTDYSYSAFGEMASSFQWTDRNNRVYANEVRTNWYYDRRGNRTVQVDDANSNGKNTSLWYSPFGQVYTRNEYNVRVFQARYDRNGHLVQQLDGGNVWAKMEYDAFGNVLSQTDRSGNKTQYSFTAFNREVRTTTAEGIQTVVKNNAHGQTVEIVDGRGNSTVYEYDLDGRLIRTTTPAGTVTAVYDQAGQVIESVDARGIRTTFSYDAAGRVLERVVDPAGLAIRTKYEYDAKGQLVRATDPLGVVTETRYDLGGQKIAVVVDAGEGRLNLTTTYDYDPLGRLLRVTEGAGTAAAQLTLNAYNKLGQLISVTVDPNGAALKTQFVYWRDNLVSRTDAAGKVTRYVYDTDHRLTHTVDPTGSVEVRSYDADGRLVQSVAYAERIDPAALSDYPTADNVQQVLSAQGENRVARLVYDRDGRLRYTLDSYGAVVESVYDNSGNVVRSVAYATPIALTGPATAAAVAAALTAQSAAEHAADRATRRVYDGAGRLAFELTAANNLIGYEYDANGSVLTQLRYAAPYPAGAAIDQASLQAWAQAQPRERVADEHWIYDAAGRVAWQVNAVGMVTRNTYDAAGNRRMSVVFTQAAQYPWYQPQAYTADGMAAWHAQYVGIEARYANPTTMWFYDAAGREVFSYDALGYFSERVYDAAGQVSSTTRYQRRWGMWGTDRAILLTDTGASLSALLATTGGGQTTTYRYDAAGRVFEKTDAGGVVSRYEYDGMGRVVNEYSAWGTAQQVQAKRRYDASGHLIEEINAFGKPEAATTRYAYDAFGQRIAVTDPRGVEAAESDSQWALATRKRFDLVNETGAPLRASDLSASDRESLMNRYTSRWVYDANGRVTAQYDNEGWAERRTYNAFGDAVAVADRGNAEGYFYFDAMGRVIAQVDPEGYLTRTEYDFLGRPVKVMRYANRVDIDLDPNDGVLPPMPADPQGEVATTTMEYDLLGRVVKATDAEGHSEAYSYDSFGNLSQYTNKLGRFTSYSYDYLGRKTGELLPALTWGAYVNHTIAIKNSYEYDAFGNLFRQTEAGESVEQRTTVYTYDGLNRRTGSSTVFASGQGDLTAAESFKYDPNGNLIEKIAANGARTVFYYDANNRLAGQVDPNGRLTLNEYDPNGNLTRTRAFVDAVALPAGWTLPSPVDAERVREMRFAYDQVGRKIEARTVGVAHGKLNTTPNEQGEVERTYGIDYGDIVERWWYDVNGRLLEYTDGNGNVVETTYDQLGRKTRQIDGDGYATTWEYDAEGAVLKEIRYAKPRPPYIPVPTLARAADAVSSAWPGGDWTPEPSADDRITVYTYDKMGRRLTESRLSVAYGNVDASSGRLTEGFATATTAYAYDAAGNLLRRTDANGSVFGWEYDGIGRNTATILPGFVDYAGRSVTARTEYSYNGLNQVVKEIRRGVGSDQDQVDSYVYGAGGRLLSKTNALNFTTRFGYDASGNMTTMSYLRTDSAGGQRTETIQVAYDQDNRETSRVTVGGDGSRSVERRTRYNLFGDVTGRGTGPTGWQEFADYDYAGRVLRTNMEGGVTRVHIYDGAGNAAIRIESQTEDLSKPEWTLARVLSPSSADAPKLSLTLTLFDGRNHAIDVIQASMSAEGERLGLKTVTVLPILPGAIQSSVGGRLGGQIRDPLQGAGDPLQVVKPYQGGPVQGRYDYRGWAAEDGSDVPDNWPPNLMLYDVWVPDFSALIGSQYDVRVEIGGIQHTKSEETGQEVIRPLQGDGYLLSPVGRQKVQIRVPVGLFDLRNGDYRDVAMAMTVKVYVTPKGSGGGRELEIASGQADAVLFWRKEWDWDTEIQIAEGSMDVDLQVNPPEQFSNRVIQLPGDGYRRDVSPQVYVRAKGSNGPYEALTVQRDFDQGKATANIGHLSGSEYEVLYVATREDGALMRREKYDLTVGENPILTRAPDTTDATFQTNGLGTFVWSSSGLDMSNLLTRRAQVPKKVVVEYRRKGSQDAWVGTAGLPGLPPLKTDGTVRWDTTGLSGDYEVVLKLLGDNDKLLESIAGEVGIGANPRVALDFAHDADVVRLSNLPPNASAVDLTLLNEDGSIAWTAAGLSIANGALNWPIPPEILAAAGNGVRRYGMKLTFTDNLVVPPSSYNAVGSIEVGPQREPKAVIQVDQHLYTLNLDPKQPEGQVLVLHYRPEGNVATPFKEVVILRGADGKFRWDSLGLNKEATYEYFYDVFRTLGEAQNPAGSQSLVRNSGYFWPDNDRPATEASWEIKNFEPSSLTIHRRQEYNAFGEIAREIDGRGNATALSYNTLGKLTRKTDPLVWVTRANGFREEINPFTEYVNDLAGNVVAYRDANGNLTTQAWNYGSAKPTLVGEWHADGGFKRFQYDVFGNQRVAVDELGRTTGYSYDRGNRLVSIQRPKGEGETGEIIDSYAYDELDRRIRHTSSLLGATTTDFDIEGEVSRVVTAGGRTTTYSSVWSDAITGDRVGWIRTMTDANGRSLIDFVDAFGHKFWHKDLGDRWFTYEYNYAGLLSKSGTTVYEYYANGLIKRMNDAGSGIKASYEYDENGNRTFEGFTGKDGNWAFQQSKGTYDALNRLIKIEDPRYEITYEFDAQGNRIRMHSLYKDGLNGATRVQEYWYQYDSMNRFTVTMGKLSGNGQTRGSSATDNSVWVFEGNEDGVLLAYDQANQRRMAKYGRDGHTERYDYDARGYLTDTVIDGVLRARRVNDLAGRVGDYYEYDANGTLKNSSSRTWDNDSLLMLEHDNLANKGTETYRLADGTVDFTETYGEETTVKTSYAYEWFDSAKQSQIMVQASNQDVKNWAPGFSRYVYDSQGRIKLAYDQAGNRGFAYQVDGEGRILQRDELIGGEVDANGNVSNAQQNRHHSYYFFDDRQIGNVGNDGIDRIDYAKELAQNEAQAGAKNDDRHKRFTPVAGANFDENYQPINSLYPTAAPGSYIVKSGDTLQGIAAALWGDAAMWYLLADANGLAPNQPLIPNTVLTVPNKVTNIHNNASTFKPYDAGSAMGNTSPTVPEPPPPPSAKKGCGGFVQVLAVIVAVVVTIYTAGAAAAAMSATLSTGGAIGATMSAGLSVLGGTAVGGLGAGALVGAAAIGGAVGSIASQAVMIAGGLQDGFDWKGVAMGALGSAVTAGLAGASGVGGLLGKVEKVAGGFGRAAASGALNSAVTGGLSSALDLGSFSWKDVAISAISSGVGFVAEEGIGRLQYGGKQWSWLSQDGMLQTAARNNDWGRTLVRGFGSGLASGATSAAARGNLSSEVLMRVGLDALGNTVGALVSQQTANRSSVPDSLRQTDSATLMEMDRLARNAGRAPDSLNANELGVLARAAETGTESGQNLTSSEITSRTRDYLSIVGRFDSADVDQAMGLYAKAGLTELYAEVGKLDTRAIPSELPAASVDGLQNQPQVTGSWINEVIDQGLIGTGYVGREVSENIEKRPWLKVAAVGLDVAAGPVKFAVNQAIQASPVGDLIESATGAVAKYVDDKLSSVGHNERDSTDGGLGGVMIGSMIAGGAWYAIKKLGASGLLAPVSHSSRSWRNQVGSVGRISEIEPPNSLGPGSSLRHPVATRVGRLKLEKNWNDLSPTEKQAALAFQRSGADVEVLLEASKKGIHNQPTPEFRVNGSVVDVITPTVFTPTAVARAVEKKVRAGQADSFAIVVPDSFSKFDMYKSAVSSYGKVVGGAPIKVDKIWFLQGDKMIGIDKNAARQWRETVDYKRK